MTEVGGRRKRAPGGVALSAVLPGLGQILAGRLAAGAAALGVWVSFLLIAVTRFARVRAAVNGPWDAKLAVAVLVLGLAATWEWSRRDVSGRRGAWARRASRWEPAVRAFSKNRLAVLGLGVVVALCLVALLTPLLAPFDPTRQGNLVTGRLLPPSRLHLLGTDQLSRDVLSRLLYGARISLTIGFVAVAISVTVGTLLGAVAGYVGGWVDTLLMRFVDMVISFPRLVLLITLVALFRPSILIIIAVLGLTLWPTTARIVRGEVLGLREREFVQAARALGYSRRRIVARHVLPNALGPVIVTATLGIGDTIVLAAGLSFLGLGVQPPTPSWGTMVATGRVDLLGAWWISTSAGLAIVLTVLCFNLVGDGLRDALDPRIQA